MFHQFEVTRTLRGEDTPVTRTIIVPADSALPDRGFWVARNEILTLYPRAEVRALGISTRRIWEVHGG